MGSSYIEGNSVAIFDWSFQIIGLPENDVYRSQVEKRKIYRNLLHLYKMRVYKPGGGILRIMLRASL